MTNELIVRQSGRRRFASVVGVSCVLLMAVIFLSTLAMRRKEAARSQESGASASAQESRERLVGQETSGRIAPPRFSSLLRTENRRTRAMDLLTKSRLEGAKLPSGRSMFEEEARDPVWAPAMEAQIAGLIRDANALFADNGFPDFKVSEAECRESMCTLTVSYPESTLERARLLNFLEPRETPWGHVLSQLGPFSEVVFEHVNETTWNPDSTKSVKKRVHLAFGKASADPAEYARWQRQAHQAKVERRLKARGPVP
jgi:hypothetical protein